MPSETAPDTFQQIQLKIVQLAASHGIPKDDICVAMQPGYEDIIIMLQGQIAAWQPNRVVKFKHPAGWFEMLKAQYAPEWVKKILPVKYHEEEYEAITFLKDFPIPADSKPMAGVTAVDGFVSTDDPISSANSEPPTPADHYFWDERHKCPVDPFPLILNTEPTGDPVLDLIDGAYRAAAELRTGQEDDERLSTELTRLAVEAEDSYHDGNTNKSN